MPSRRAGRPDASVWEVAHFHADISITKEGMNRPGSGRICSSRIPQQVYSPLELGSIWRWVYSNKIPIYPVFHLLKGDYTA